MGGTDPGAAAPRPPWPGGAAWIDGQYCPIEDAKISVLDLGVTRSDCTYDVVHVWRGRFYRLDAHLDRFGASMARLRLDPGLSRAEIEAILHGCVRHAGLQEAYVSMTCRSPRRRGGGSVADFEEPCIAWRKSTASNSGGCLEVAVVNGSVLVRDSTNRDGPVLPLSLAAWSGLLARARDKDFGLRRD